MKPTSPLMRFIYLEPTFSALLVAACLIAGWFALTGMAREENPDLAIPQAIITVEWPGAFPGQIETQLLDPLEEALRGMPDVATLLGSAHDSFALVSVRFDARANIDSAMQLLRSRVDQATADFPRGARKPHIEQIAVNDTPVLTYVLSGSTDDRLLANTGQRLSRDLETVADVRKVQLFGHRPERLHVRLDPVAMRSLGLSAVAIRERIRDANLDISWGELEEGSGSYPLSFDSRFATPQALADLVIADLGDGRVIRLAEVADVYVGLEQDMGSSQVSNRGGAFTNAVTLSVLKRPGADTIKVINAVQREVRHLQSQPDWPRGLQLHVTSDESLAINSALHGVGINLLQGMAAVFIVLLLLLTWREAMVAALGIPVTILAALGMLYATGHTLNTLVVIGIVIALGLLVDMFILVMEGLHERLFIHHMAFAPAVIDTARAFFLPALAGQLTTILAMVPLLMIGGVDGKFIRLIPIAAITCLCASFLLAFLAALPLSRYALQCRGQPPGTTVADRMTLQASGWLTRFLIAGPLASRRRSVTVVGAAVMLFVMALVVAADLPYQDYPKEDGRNLGITLALDTEATLADARRIAAKAGRALTPAPYLDSVITHVGEKSPFALKTLDDLLAPLSGYHLVGISARFVSKSAREALAYTYLPDIRRTLQDALADEPGVRITLHPDLGGATAQEPLQIQLLSDDLHQLRQSANEVMDVLKTTAGVTDVRDTLGEFRSELSFSTDRESLAFYGLTETDLAEQVRIALSGDKIGTFKQPGVAKDLDIMLGVNWPSRQGELGAPTSFAEIESMSLASRDGVNVPLMGVVDMSIAERPVAISHQDGQRAMTVKARLDNGVTVTDVAGTVVARLREVASEWPAGTHWQWRGASTNSTEASQKNSRAFVIAVLLVFAILALLFRSFVQPLIILTTIPLAMTGTFLGFALFDIALSFPALVGIIALIGIVVNDAIVMVDTMNGHLAQGKAIRQAAAHGAADRLRPVVTTTVTTLAGLIPLALSAPMWFPLCMAIIFGEVLSTLFAIVVIPALFVLTTGRMRSGDVASLAGQSS